MKKTLHRFLCLILTCSLLQDSAFCQPFTGPAQDSTVPRVVTPAILECALAVYPLGDRHFSLRPFRSFSHAFPIWITSATQHALFRPVVAMGAGLLLQHFQYLSSDLPFLLAMTLGPPANGNGASHSEHAAEAAATYWSQSRHRQGELRLTESRRIADRYMEFAKAVGIPASDDILAAAHLTGIPETSQDVLRSLREPHRHQVLSIHKRVTRAYRIPFDPPFSDLRVEPNVITNQMGIYGKFLDSVDELLLVMARKVTVLERSGTLSRASKALLYEEIEFVLTPLLKRLGMNALAERLKNEAHGLAHPSIHRRTTNLIQAMIGMTADEANVYSTALAAEIRSKLPASLQAHVSGTPKQATSVARKKRVRAGNHRSIRNMEDLLRWRVVLGPGANADDRDNVVTVLGNLHTSTGRLTTHGVPELKMLPGYNAFHITFVGIVNGHEVAHEYQIFMNPEEYYRYEYGWPNAHWAYTIKELTGVLPDFELFEVDPTDPRANFKAFQKAIDSYTYFFVATEEPGHHDHLTASRIPHADKRGNVADAAVARRKLDRRTAGAMVYRRSFDPTEEQPYLSTPHLQVPLDYLIENGEVIEITEWKAAFHDVTSLRQIERTASTLPALAVIHGWLRQHPETSVPIGRKRLIARLNEIVNGTARGIKTLNAFYEDAVLQVIASRLSFGTPGQLLAALGLDPFDDYTRQEQEKLWERIRIETKLLGSKLLERNKIPVANSDVWHQLEAVASKPPLHLKSADALLLAVGTGHVSIPAIQRALEKERGRLAAASRHHPAEPEPEKLTLDAQFLRFNGHFHLDVTVNNDQSGLSAAILPILTKHQFTIQRGTRSEMVKTGAYLSFELTSDNPQLDLFAIEDEIRGLSIDRREHLDTPHRFSVSLLLDNRFSALNDFFQELHRRVDGANAPHYYIDEDNWLEMTLGLPSLAEKFPGQSPQAFLHHVLKDMQENLQIDGAPLIHAFEVSDAHVSETTAADILQHMKLHGPFKWIKRPVSQLIRRTLGTRRVDQSDSADVSLCDHGMQLAEDLHAGEHRLEKGHPAFIVHPYNSAETYIRAGGRDVLSILVLLLHDSVENYPRREFQKRYPRESDPKEDDPRLFRLQQDTRNRIADAFPGLAHQILKGIEQMTYTRGLLISHAEQMVAMGDHRLTARKLAENADNLRTLFKVDIKKHPGFSPVEQIAKSMRYWLPLVTQESEFKNDLYTNIRRIWLRQLILQSHRLSNDQFLGLLYVQRDKNENIAHVRSEFLGTLSTFIDWIPRNADSMPQELGTEKLKLFRDRLVELRNHLDLQAAQTMVPPEDTPPPSNDMNGDSYALGIPLPLFLKPGAKALSIASTEEILLWTGLLAASAAVVWVAGRYRNKLSVFTDSFRILGRSA